MTGRRANPGQRGSTREKKINSFGKKINYDRKKSESGAKRINPGEEDQQSVKEDQL
ncbi:hypothetical protein [Sediminibacillus terrae]|uniref:hypothetical protein n=1 Tax=Sediminibacillus terrae TaxID=1562106 RepID=UPI001296F538|nr:hypothetical protein [Sediminibacillus terrae]